MFSGPSRFWFSVRFTFRFLGTRKFRTKLVEIEKLVLIANGLKCFLIFAQFLDRSVSLKQWVVFSYRSKINERYAQNAL